MLESSAKISRAPRKGATAAEQKRRTYAGSFCARLSDDWAGPWFNHITRNGRTTRLLKAVNVRSGKQAGMKSVSLRGMVEIDPHKDDLFRRVIEHTWTLAGFRAGMVSVLISTKNP